MCKYQENNRVKYSLDTDGTHWYIVRDSTPGTTANDPCFYHIQLENDPGVQMVNVPESYMTDTDEGDITSEAPTAK